MMMAALQHNCLARVLLADVHEHVEVVLGVAVPGCAIERRDKTCGDLAHPHRRAEHPGRIRRVADSARMPTTVLTATNRHALRANRLIEKLLAEQRGGS
jgi:hypothetical protein